MNRLIKTPKNQLLKNLWSADTKIRDILINSRNTDIARECLFNHIDSLEEKYFDVHSNNKFEKIHVFEKKNAKECIRVIKNIIRSENEDITGCSALQNLIDLAKKKERGY